MGTYGEERTLDILCKLPESEFNCYYEPRIKGPIGTDRYPDFLIVWRSKGVLAVEIKDYKHINIENSDQIEIEVVKDTGEILRKPNPIRTVKKYSDNIITLFERRREFLHTYRGVEKLSFPCEGIVLFAHIEEKQLQRMIDCGIFSEHRVLPANALQNESTLLNYLEKVPWTWQIKTPITAEMVETISYEIRMNSVNRQGKKVGDLNQKQDEIVHRPLPFQDGSYSADLVRGSVGSGKTIVLIKRAEWLKNMRPELNILVCAFNIDLTQDLRERIQNPKIKVVRFFDLCKEILGASYPKLEEYRDEQGPRTIKKWVQNQEELFKGEGLKYETVMEEIARRKDKNLSTDEQYKEDVTIRKAPFSTRQIDIISIMYDEYIHYQDELKREGDDGTDWEDIPDLTLNALFGHKLERSFDVVMIDEAQDWSPKWIRVIKRLLKPGGYLFMCDDPAQSLWRFYNWEQKGVKGISIINLELPERTTKEIMDCAQCLFDIEDKLHANYDLDVYPVKTEHLLRGKKPKIVIFRSPEQEKDGIPLIVENVLLEKKDKERVGVLCPNYGDIKEWRDNQIIKDNNIYLGHFNLMKGLEFETVIIPRIDQLFKEDISNDVSYELSNMRKLFVAMTRAKKELILTCSRSFPQKITPLTNFCTIEKE